MKKNIIAVVVAVAAIGPTAALAQTVSATVPFELNLRAGPDPQFPVVGVIPPGSAVDVTGCIEDLTWCEVGFGGQRGWADGGYLLVENTPIAAMPAGSVEITEYNGVQYFDQNYAGMPFYADRDTILGGVAAGAAGGAIIGALIAGPIGAAIGAGVGAGVGGAVDSALPPPDSVRTYMASQTTASVYLSGEVVVGAKVPDVVVLSPVPDYYYNFAYINGQWVLVDPTTRTIVYIVR